MSTITVYTFEGPDGTEDTYQTQDPEEARDYGRRTESRVIANEFVWDDSDTAWDFRPRVYRAEAYGVGMSGMVKSEAYEDQEDAEDVASTAESGSLQVAAAVFGVELPKGSVAPLAPVEYTKVAAYTRDGERIEEV